MATTTYGLKVKGFIFSIVMISLKLSSQNIFSNLVLGVLFLQAEVFQENVTLGVGVGVSPDREVAASHVQAADVVVKSFRIVI